MSINPRSVLAWLVAAALAVAYCPTALAAGHGGGGFHSGGGFHGSAAFHSGSVGHAWSGTPLIASRSFAGGIHTGSFVGRAGNWNHWGNSGNWNRGAYWGNAGNFWRNPSFAWNDWWRYGYYRPWIGLGWWPYYSDYGYNYPYSDSYSYEYPYGDYDSGYDTMPYSVATPETPETVETQTPVEPAAPMLASSEEGGFQSQALDAFRQGEYQEAVRLATHAIVDDPKSPDAHLLLSLSLFAVGQYRGAAMEAHSVASLGTVPDWTMVVNIYGTNVESYTTQLRALEKFVRTNPSKPEGRFLLGFQYMIDGHRSVASDQFLQALQLAPRDKLAAQLLTREGGAIPANVAKQLESAQHRPPASGTEPSVTK